MNKDSIVKKLGLTGICLCVLCCSLPLLGMSIGIAAFTPVAFYLEKIGIILIGAAVILFFYSRLKKKAKRVLPARQTVVVSNKHQRTISLYENICVSAYKP